MEAAAVREVPKKQFWDFTLNCEDNRDDSIQRCLGEYATHWAYQAEEAARVHYNGRLQMIKGHGKRHVYEMVALFKGSPLEGAHWSPTSTNGSKTFNYGLKKDTRVRGPWTDKMAIPEDPAEQAKLAEAREIPTTLRPFQAELLAKDLGRRTICWVYDPNKETGKSEFLRYACHFKLAVSVPSHYRPEEAMKFISRAESERYIFDLPAAWNADGKEAQALYSTLETVKDGILSDWRHSSYQKVIKRPQVIVLANALPNCHRWRDGKTDRVRIYSVDPFFELCDYDEMDQAAIDDAFRKRRLADEEKTPAPPKKRSKLFA